jgi:hypothetical protein
MHQTFKLVQKMIENTNAQITTEPANSGKPLLYAGAAFGGLISLYNGDCLQALKQYDDNHFDIAIVDPPYGIGISSNPFRQKHEKCDWDNAVPNKQYFDELMRVSKNQIIWGGNYFDLPPSQGFIVWDKKQPQDFIRTWWDKQCFDLKLKDYEGNCDMCWKKSERKLLTLILEKPHLIEWWNEMEIKYGQGEISFFRNNKTAIDLIEMSKQNFTKATDEYEAGKCQIKLFDYDLDIEYDCFCKSS